MCVCVCARACACVCVCVIVGEGVDKKGVDINGLHSTIP